MRILITCKFSTAAVEHVCSPRVHYRPHLLDAPEDLLVSVLNQLRPNVIIAEKVLTDRALRCWLAAMAGQPTAMVCIADRKQSFRMRPPSMHPSDPSDHGPEIGRA